VSISEEARELGLRLVRDLGIDSSRAEITLFEAAKAHCASDERNSVTASDIEAVALLALRLRQSATLKTFYQQVDKQDNVVRTLLSETRDEPGGMVT
jgi:magnesium chelatase subunit I